MQWFYALEEQRLGPVEESAMAEMIRAGQVLPTTLVWHNEMRDWAEARTTPLSAYFMAAVPPPLPQQKKAGNTSSAGRFGHLTDKVWSDLRSLTPQLMSPLHELKSFAWLKNPTLLTIAGIGLFPLLCLTLFDDIKSAYWALALYFSTLWAVFFYKQFPSPQVTRKQSLLCFFGTGVVSIAILLLVQKLPPVQWLLGWTQSDNFPTRFVGMFLGVAVLEELCKAAMVFVTLKTAAERPGVPALLFYGLMCGLGFGIYEGVSYQMGMNLSVRHMGAYYLLNVIRLTTLPFLHAIWTGTAGYFIGLSAAYPQRKHGLIAAAILIPATLHALHNTVPSSIGLAIDFLSVLALIVYLQQSAAFEKACAVPGAPCEPAEKRSAGAA